MSHPPKLLLLCLALALSSCVNHPKQQMVRTTVSRPIVMEGRMGLNGSRIMTSGVESVTTDAPYESEAYKIGAAGLFPSR